MGEGNSSSKGRLSQSVYAITQIPALMRQHLDEARLDMVCYALYSFDEPP